MWDLRNPTCEALHIDAKFFTDDNHLCYSAQTIMSWIFLSILAALFWACTNISDKYVLGKLVQNVALPTIAMGVISVIAAAAIFFSRGFQPLSFIHIMWALVGGFFYVVMALFYFLAVKNEEISRVIALFYLSPIFVLALAGVFLGELFTPLKYLGIFLLVVGAIVVSSDGSLNFSFGKPFWFMVLASATSAVTQVITKYLLGFADFWTVFSWVRIGAFVPLIPLLMLNVGNFKELFRSQGIKPFAFMSLSEGLNILGILCLTLASVTGFITLVNALASVQPVFVLLFATLASVFLPHVLSEKTHVSAVTAKVLGIAIIVVGAILVS